MGLRSFFTLDRLRRRQHREDLVQQIADAVVVLRRDRQDVAEAEAAKVFGLHLHRFGVDLVHGEKDVLATALQQTRKLHVRRGEFGARVNNHDDGVGLFQRNLRLAEDLCGDQRFVVGHHTSGVDQAGTLALPLHFAVDAVAGDAGLVTHDGAAAVRQPVEERRLAHIRPPADRDQRQSGSVRRLGGGRDACLVDRIDDPPVALIRF